MKKRIFLSVLSTLYFVTLSFAQVSIADTTYYVLVSYSGNSATVEMTDDVKSYVTASVNGADVTISSTASASISEITYGLTGATTDGSFTMVGTYKATMELFGVTITNPDGPAIDIQNGKRIEISAKSGTTSTLTDGTSTATDAWKGAFQCKGHTEFKGKGTLNVYGNYAHAIWNKEYIEVKNCTINVYSAVKDAINCNQYFSMESGVINLSGFGDDGIQVSLKTNDTSTENTGNFTMTGGTINIDMTGASGDSVKAEGTKSVASSAALNVTNTQSVDQVPSDQVQSTKIIMDGKLYLMYKGRMYDVQGNQIK